MPTIRKYKHAYHQTLTIKMMLAEKDKPDEYVNFERALEIIGKVHDITLGIPLIVYLVGWQYDGHDSKYPAWFEVNHRLKRAPDATALESLQWLMQTAKTRYGATVSLHINMDDAYESSPLWEEYVRANLLARGSDGQLRKGAMWGGERSYIVSKRREWESGHARQRIDRLLDMLPLAEAGTIHIDVFQPQESAYHGISRNDDIDAMKQIVKYWNSRGVDVTKEWFHHEFAGLVPMVYHLCLDEASRLKYPVSLICGGGSAWNHHNQIGPDTYPRYDMPEPDCLYPRAWGEAMYAESDIQRDPQKLSNVLENFCLKTLPWYFLNRLHPRRHVQTAESYEVHFSENTLSSVNKTTGRYTLSQNGRLFVDGSDLCMPALWRDRELIAFSREGCAREWDLPPDWPREATAAVDEITVNGNRPLSQTSIRNGRLSLEIKKGHGLCVRLT